MNWAETAYFKLFVLWTRKRKDRDIAGVWTLLTLFLGFWFNIGTLLLLTIAFNLVEYDLPELPNRITMMSFIILLMGLTGLLLMRKGQMTKYRNRLLGMSLDEIKRTSRNAGIYVAATLITIFVTACLTMNYMANQ